MAQREGRGGSTVFLVISFVLLLGAFLFLRSPFFDVSEFVITGHAEVSKEEILARCGQTTRSIFAFDTALAKELIEASPWVLKAEVRRHLPRTISIAIEERIPVAFVPSGDKLWLVDMEGRVLGPDDGSRPDLVALTGPAEFLEAGTWLPRSTYGWGLAILGALGPHARERLMEISVHAPSPSLILDDECRVVFGDESPTLYARCEALESVLEELWAGGTLAQYIDLRHEKVAVRLWRTDDEER